MVVDSSANVKLAAQRIVRIGGCGAAKNQFLASVNSCAGRSQKIHVDSSSSSAAALRILSSRHRRGESGQ